MAAVFLRRIIFVIAIALCGAILVACSGGGGTLSKKSVAVPDAPLHEAARRGDIAEVNRLIDEGADVNAKISYDITPLHVAIWNGQTEIVSALIKAGADINAKNKIGEAPLHIVIRKGLPETALALIKAGADVNATNQHGNTPLHIAIQKGLPETALALIKAGVDVNATNQHGNTPLHIAVRSGQENMVIALIHAGVYIRATNDKGHTPLDIARHNKQWNMVALLENPPPSGESAPGVAVAPAPEDGGVAEFVFENAWRSVVFVETNDSIGSGVIIRPNIVATNCHVIDGGGIVVYKAENRRTDKSKKYRATIRRRDEKNDFCLIDVAGLWGVAANVRRYDSLRVGENVYGIGAPKGLDLSLTSGLISQKRAADGVRYIQTDVAISPGSSGGGLFDRKGNLVGILTSKLVDDDIEGIGFAIPADLAIAGK